MAYCEKTVFMSFHLIPKIHLGPQIRNTKLIIHGDSHQLPK